MNTEQLAEIRSALSEVVQGAPDTCATLQAEGDPDKWVQMLDHTINAAYPHSDNPEERTRKSGLPSLSAELLDWEPGKFATFEFADLEENGVTAWIDGYLAHVIGCGDGAYQIDITFEQM
jgi:hypothetical protein